MHARASTCPACETRALPTALKSKALPKPARAFLQPPAAPSAAPPRRTPLARPAAFSSEFRAAEVAAPSCDAAVSPKYAGLSQEQLGEAFRAEHPGLLEALAGAAAAAAPATAARLLRRLEAELPPALTDVVPGGDCVLVAVAPGLLPLLERATVCCEASLAAGDLQQCADTGRALLSLTASLAFGCAESAAPYAALATRCKQALKCAYDAGARLRQEDVVELEAACARSSPWLWLTPWFGHRCAAAVDGFAAAGWRTGELAVRFTEAYCALVGRGRLHQVEAKVAGMFRAAMRHPLGLEQTGRLLAAARRLPVEMRISLALHARSHPCDDWQAQVQGMHALRQQEAELAAAAAARHTAGAAGERPTGAGGAAKAQALVAVPSVIAAS